MNINIGITINTNVSYIGQILFEEDLEYFVSITFGNFLLTFFLKELIYSLRRNCFQQEKYQ